MALYIGEEDVWKCPKHPSKRHRNGICPACLRERLGILCPDCATIRPCTCSTTTATSSSSSSSASSSSSFRRVFSSFSSSSRTTFPNETEPSFQKSKSVAVPFVRSRFSTSMRENIGDKNWKTSFWASFLGGKSKTGGVEGLKCDLDNDEGGFYYNSKIGDFEKMMVKSRSMRATITLEKSSTKGKSWHFPSPIKVFRQRSKVVQERSPLQRF